MLTTGGIQWEVALTPSQRKIAEYMFMSQFGAFLELYFPNWNVTIVSMDLDHPQRYRCLCPFCGLNMYFDFWGMLPRGFDQNNVKVLQNHFCVKEAPKWRSRGYPFPVPNAVIRDTSNQVCLMQKMIFRLQLHHLTAVHAELYCAGQLPFEQILAPRWEPEDWQIPARLQGRLHLFAETGCLRFGALFALPDATIASNQREIFRAWCAFQLRWYTHPPWNTNRFR